jgi:hypothetical protein
VKSFDGAKIVKRTNEARTVSNSYGISSLKSVFKPQIKEIGKIRTVRMIIRIAAEYAIIFFIT